MKISENQKFIIIAIVSIISAVLTSLVTSTIQNENISDELSELKDSNKILNATLQVQLNQNKIMNMTLQQLEKSIEKESLISVKVLPYVESTLFSAGVYERITGGEITDREIYHTKSQIKLQPNSTILFDIIITNVGTDTAVLNTYVVEVFSGYSTGSSRSLSWNDINLILPTNSLPLIIPYELEIDDSFYSQGQIFFIVSHDNGVDESYSISYEIDE